MIKAVLFDLDNTLLDNNLDRFMPAYFRLVGDFAARRLPELPRQRFLEAIITGTRAAMSNVQPDLTNQAVFWRSFAADTGLDPAAVAPLFVEFYEHRFAELQPLTAPRPAARPLVDWCFDQGYQVVIATNPVFPRRAIEHRLAWAGLPVADYPFALVTTLENMHAAKPQPAYYGEIRGRLGLAEGEAIMVGDNYDHDIVPAGHLRLATYWIAAGERPAPGPVVPDAQGSLDRLYDCCRRGWLDAL